MSVILDQLYISLSGRKCQMFFRENLEMENQDSQVLGLRPIFFGCVKL